MRAPTHREEDPLDHIWVMCAARIGLRPIGGEAALTTQGIPDADDSLAQRLFHALCHSLLAGAESLEAPRSFTDVHTAQEHACIRVQATLSRPHGLRAFFAPTTHYRAYFDALPADALADSTIEVVAARRAVACASRAPWAPHLEDALAATAAVLTATLPPLHPRTRFPLAVGERARETCGGCAWLALSGVCRQSERRRRTRPDEPACERWGAQLDCLRCGACCREAFGAVTVRAKDLVVTKHAALVRVESDGFRTMRRVPEQSALSGPDDTRCVALTGDGSSEAPFMCEIYVDRPRTCHDFTLGSAHCLTARRRVGLSR